MSPPQRYEFSFEATPALGTAALKCTLRKRSRFLGPAALVLLPVLLAVLASRPEGRLAAAALGGAAIMLFVIFLLALAHRRRMRERFFRQAADRIVRIALDGEGVRVSTALGDLRLPWQAFERVWRCKDVTMLYYHGWQYVAVPEGAAPTEALAFAEQRIAEARAAPRRA